MLHAKSETHSLSGTAPSEATQGIETSGTEGATCVISAPSGQTISGGSLLCYYYGPVSVNADGTVAERRWMRYAAGDFTPATGQRDAASGDNAVYVGAGRLTWVPSGITLSGVGTTVTVTLVSRRRR